MFAEATNKSAQHTILTFSPDRSGQGKCGRIFQGRHFNITHHNFKAHHFLFSIENKIYLEAMGCLKLGTYENHEAHSFTGVWKKSVHSKSDVDYYPFGLAFNSYSRENSVPNRWKFQGQEHIDDLGLNWDQFKWRNHQPDIGRFFNVDPLAEKYYYNSPYAFSENKVVAHRELEGLESWPINLSDGTRTTTHGPWQNQQAAEQHADNQLMISPIANPKVTSSVNMKRMHPVLKVVRPHKGVDLVNSNGQTKGSQVSAPVNGTVIGKGFQENGAGNFVKIQATKDGQIHKFFHMENSSTDHLEVNQEINRGERVGSVGQTGGISSGPHLHYEVRGQKGEVLQPTEQNPSVESGVQNISVVPTNNNTSTGTTIADHIRSYLNLL